MKNQVKSPIQILVEILVVIFISSVKILIMVAQLMYELYLSLRIMSYSNPMGFILALTVGGIILFFTLKFMFGSTMAAMKIIAIYIVIVVLLLTIFGGSVILPKPPTNTTP